MTRSSLKKDRRRGTGRFSSVCPARSVLMRAENQPVPFLRKDALNRQEGYQYDASGNLKTFTDRKGQASTFTYDNLRMRDPAFVQEVDDDFAAACGRRPRPPMFMPFTLRELTLSNRVVV